MSWTQRFALLVCLFSFAPLQADEFLTPEQKRAEKLVGVWLPDTVAIGKQNGLGRMWQSKLTIGLDSFRLSKPMDHPNDLVGKFAINLKAGANDLQVRR
jgi:hypothetical protein